MKDEKISADIDKILKLNVKDIIGENKILSKYFYFVVFYKVISLDLLIYHIIGYESYPSDKDILHNCKELKTDEEFKLSPDILDNLKYRVIEL